jgi:hypothetical protein
MLFQFSMLLIFCVGPCLSNPASPQDAAITEANWQTHPKIKMIRQLVSSTNHGLKSKAFKTSERRFDYCNDAFFTLKRIAREAKGEVKWYGDYSEGEDSSWDYQQYYDPQGHLRFVLVTVYAANSSREQHRYYFDETGKLIWQNRKRLRGPGYFAPPNVEQLVTVDPAKAFADDEGCKELKPLKPKPKHRNRVASQ